MSVSASISRITEYCTRHGFKATIRRAGLAVKRGLFSGRMLVFYCDLAEQVLPAVAIPDSITVDRLTSEAQISARDLESMTSFWNPALARRNVRERFNKGASLWLIKSGDNLAGYGWTLQGRTIEPYYLPLGQDDVHLFDFYVFPQYRGRGLNPYLVTQILRALGIGRARRAFIDAAEWNHPQLSSLKKTPFRTLGLARSITIIGHRFTHWTDEEPLEQALRAREGREKAPAMARPRGR